MLLWPTQEKSGHNIVRLYTGKKDLGEIQCMHHACHTLTEFRIPWGRYLFRVPAAPENFLSAKDKFLTSGALRKYRLAR